jgi:hypothetical protein
MEFPKTTITRAPPAVSLLSLSLARDRGAAEASSAAASSAAAPAAAPDARRLGYTVAEVRVPLGGTLSVRALFNSIPGSSLLSLSRAGDRHSFAGVRARAGRDT